MELITVGFVLWLASLLNSQSSCAGNKVFPIDKCWMRSKPSQLSSYDVPRFSQLSYPEFHDLWDGTWPVVITDIIGRWPAASWNPELLIDRYSDMPVTVTFSQGSLSDIEGKVMSLGEFYTLSRDIGENGSPSWMYLSDELFLSDNPLLYYDIGSNEYVDVDYFQLFPEDIRPKDAMLLWGTIGSRSKLHVDPYNWTGTLALLHGTKQWKLFPPDCTADLALVRQRLGFPLDCHHLVSSADLFKDGHGKDGVDERLTGLEYTQKSGEMLIIPSGWAHQVYNSQESLAISSQFMNDKSYDKVIAEILQCTNTWQELPQDFDDLKPEDKVKTLLSVLPSQSAKSGWTDEL